MDSSHPPFLFDRQGPVAPCELSALVVAEMETMDTPFHGPTREVQMPACPSCGHQESVTLPVIWDERGSCYYARGKRPWVWTSWPGLKSGRE